MNYSTLPFVAILSCGGEKLYPNCSYCPQSNNAIEGHGCNGNCKFDLLKRICEKKGNHVNTDLNSTLTRDKI